MQHLITLSFLSPTFPEIPSTFFSLQQNGTVLHPHKQEKITALYISLSFCLAAYTRTVSTEQPIAHYEKDGN